jgi:uncharacterized LabA/DUF88 family protein
MAFIDGENLTIRGQNVATSKGIRLIEGKFYRRDVFVWLPGKSKSANEQFMNFPGLQQLGTRSYYYTSVIGDDVKIFSVREALHDLGFQPEVFKRDSGSKRSKGVDLALAKDILSNAFNDNYDVALLYASDGDYVPIVNEVKRLGKVVYLVTFTASAYSAELGLAADIAFNLEDFFCDTWTEFANSETNNKSPGKTDAR